MTRSQLFMIALFFSIFLMACNHNKPKPTSTDITKQTVKVNGVKDSVINNAQKNYGNATVSEPCVRCLVQAVQSTADYKQSIAGINSGDIIYKVSWIKADGTVDTANTKGATNALKLEVMNKHKRKYLSAFIYDNSISKLYNVKNDLNSNNKSLKIDSIQLKKIRNACYWGVASGK